VAREITHEAFLRLWERRDRLAADSNEKAWLMRVAINLAITHRRGMLVRRRHVAPPVMGVDPAAQALARIEGDAMRRALLTLQPYERAVVGLRYQQDLSFLEIGEMLGRPEATVRTSCHRALEKLHRQLEPSTGNRPVAKVGNGA
jgi:RNA polymerase sigma-70 factor (ECF subfamily)